MTSRKIAIAALLVGASLVMSVWALSLLEVGKFGDDANIGAGALLLAGCTMTLGGAVSLTRTWLTSRSRRRR